MYRASSYAGANVVTELTHQPAGSDPALLRWRSILVVSSIVTVLTWLVAMFLVTPNADGTARVAATSAEKILLLLFVAAAVSAWVAALAHAWRALRTDGVRRTIVVALLVVGNFFAAIIYLALFAAWMPRRSST